MPITIYKYNTTHRHLFMKYEARTYIKPFDFSQEYHSPPLTSDSNNTFKCLTNSSLYHHFIRKLSKMALSQSTIIFFAIIAIMAVVIDSVPIDNVEDTDSNARDGRFYGYPVGGLSGSSANAFAASNSFGGGGLGLSSSNAMASASSGATGIGFPYGK